jgi:hypothetical protein
LGNIVSAHMDIAQIRKIDNNLSAQNGRYPGCGAAWG